MVPTLLMTAHRDQTVSAAAPAILLDSSCSVFSPAHAQTPAAPASADDDDTRLRPLEPDFTLINLPTTLPLPVHGGNFHLTHRFNENLRRDDFATQASNLFGLDEGATIQLEYRFGIMKHLEAIASRTNVDRDVQFSAKYDAFHQSESRPVGLSGIVSIEGGNNSGSATRPRWAPSCRGWSRTWRLFTSRRSGRTIHPLGPGSCATRSMSEWGPACA